MAQRQVKVVITSDRFHRTDLSLEHELAARFPELDVDVSTALAPDASTMIAVASDADAIVTSSTDAVPAEVIDALTRLSVIGRYAVGYDNIDLDAAGRRGVIVTHYPGYCTNEVADHATALMLALNRRLFSSDRRVRQGEWLGHNLDTAFVAGGAIPPLREMTVGIIGFGRIGQAVGRRLKPFGCRLLVVDPVANAAAIAELGATPVTLDTALRESDIVTLHTPLEASTYHLIGTDELRAMKSTAWLVNTARGPIVDNVALFGALETGEIAGAALDVMEHEPLPPDSPLLSLPNLIVTPHSAYYSEASMETLRRETYVDVLTALAGRPPRTIANQAQLAR